MKLSKKVIAAVAAIFAVSMFAACSSEESGADDLSAAALLAANGNKNNMDMTLEGPATDGHYARFFKQLGTSENVMGFSTKVTVKEYGAGSVLGVVFNMNKYENSISRSSEKFYDLGLMGIKPETKGYYCERYYAVASDTETTGDTEAPTLGEYEDLDGKTHGQAYKETLAGDYYTTNEDGSYYFYITAAQDTKGIYNVFISKFDPTDYAAVVAAIEGKNEAQIAALYKQLGTFDTNGKTLGKIEGGTELPKTSDGYAKGGIGFYGMAPYNSKISVNFQTGKKVTYDAAGNAKWSKFFDEAVEE